MSATLSIDLRDTPSGHPAGCRSCAERVVAGVQTLAGVNQVTLVGDTAQITADYEPAVVSPSEIDDMVRRVLAESRQHWQYASLAIEGMDCADCAKSIERGLVRLPGVALVDANFSAARVDVEYDARETDPAGIERVIRELGYSVSTPTAAVESERAALLRLVRRRSNMLTLASGGLLLLGVAALLGGAETLPNVLFAGAALVGGLPLAMRGVRSAWLTRAPDINLLMTIAVVGAAFLGEWFEAATVVFLFSLGETLEGYAMDRVRRSVRGLLSLAPATATSIRDGTEVELPVGEVLTGDTIVVRPGARVPLDAVVLIGASNVNQAALTGESVPVYKEAGDQIFAGTMNTDGPLTARVTRPAADSSVARIIQLVEQAQASRAPTQRLVDRFAAYYTPAVIVLAALIAVVPPLLGADWRDWISRALVLLVIACPCALVISTPVSIVSALSAAARRGILIKGGAALERAGKVDTVAMDKTGTLTQGRPVVVTVTPFLGWSADAVLATAAGLEHHSEHPLGQAIVGAAKEQGLAIEPVRQMRVVPGKGVVGIVEGREVRAGSRRMFNSLVADVLVALEGIEATGGAAVLVGAQEQVFGVIGFADAARSDAANAVHRLHRAGVSEVVVLTGDHRAAAEQVAGSVGIDTVRAGLLPQEKLAEIEALRASGRVVAMVGDGINDAPSLAAADVGIAMGVAGTDAAIETADIALMGDDLNGVAGAIGLGKRTRRTIGLNVAFSIGVKVLTLALAVAGAATLWMAIVADVGASLLVVGNGLLLLRWRD